MTTKQRQYRYETTVTLSCVAYTEEEAREYINEVVDSINARDIEYESWISAYFEDSTQAIRKADDQDFEYDERDA